MKNKIMVVSIVVLALISCVSIGIIYYQSKNYVKIPNQYKCTTETVETEGVSYQQLVIINIDKEQYIQSYQNKSVSSYTDQSQYDFAKQIENTEQVTYTFDDETKTVISDYGVENIQDSEGNDVAIWYKEYIKNLESSGFTCQIIK